MKKRMFSMLIAVCMVVAMLPTTAFAAEGGTPIGASDVTDSGTPVPECNCTVKCIAADAENEIEAVIKADCPVCGAENADLTQCKGVAATRFTAARAQEVGIFAGRYNCQQAFDYQQSYADMEITVSQLTLPYKADSTQYTMDEIENLTFFFRPSDAGDTQFSLHSVDTNGTEVEVFAKGTIESLAPEGFVYRGSNGAGWFISNGGPVAGNSLTYTIEIPGPITHAQGEKYRANTQPGVVLPLAPTITFDANGGTVSPTSAAVGAGNKLADLPTPTRSSDHIFDGWFTIVDDPVTTETEFYSDETIYAHWTYTGSPFTLKVDSTTTDDTAPRAEGATYKTVGGAIAKAESGDTIQLQTDSTENVTTPDGEYDYAIDLNGKTLTSSSGDTIVHNSSGTLTMMDSSTGGKVESTVDYRAAIKNAATGNIVVTGGTVIATAASYHSGIENASTGNITVSGGTVSAVSTTADDPLNASSCNAIANHSSGKITVSGSGKVTSTHTAISNYSTGTVTVSGGEVTAAYYAIHNESSGAVNIDGGTLKTSKPDMILIYNLPDATGTVTITNGTMNAVGTGIVNYNGTIIISGGTVTSSLAAIQNSVKQGTAPGSVTISGGTISGGAGWLGDAVSNQSSLTVTGGNIRGIDNKNGGTVTNGQLPVYQAAFTEPIGNTGKAFSVTSPSYNLTNSAAIDGGWYVWLPEGDATATYDGTTYATTVTTDGSPSFQDPLIESISVTVAPATATVQKGKTQQFKATVTGTNSPAQTVTWAVEGGMGAVTETSISPSGLLTVVEGETAKTLTIIATSTADPTKRGTATVTVTDKDAPTPPTGGSTGGGSSSSSTVTPPTTSSNVESKGDGKVIASKVAEETATAIADAKKNGTGTRANIVAVNPVYVAPQTLQDMAVAAQKAGGTAWLFADSVVDGKVMVRIYMNTANAQSFKENILLGGTVSGKAVDYTKNKFVNFDNKMAIVSLAQQKPFAVSTEIAAKVDLTGFDTKALHFYSYDRATNKYYPISAPSYRMDKSGYLHFNTTRAGDIVITDKPLTLKK